MQRLFKRAWLLPYLTIWLLVSACSSQEVIVPKPRVVEVPGPVQWREIPDQLLIEHQPTTLPETLTWGEAAQLWIADRETIRLLLAQIQGIKSLGEPDGE